MSDALVAGVSASLAPMLVARAGRVLDAWGRLDEKRRAGAELCVEDAAARASARVSRELRELFSLPAARQRATPLQIVRGAHAEPSQVLESLGVPAVVRDEFETRAVPGDRHGLAPRTLDEVADGLGHLQMAWGVAKAAVLGRGGSKGRA